MSNIITQHFRYIKKIKCNDTHIPLNSTWKIKLCQWFKPILNFFHSLSPSTIGSNWVLWKCTLWMAKFSFFADNQLANYLNEVANRILFFFFPNTLSLSHLSYRVFSRNLTKPSLWQLLIYLVWERRVPGVCLNYLGAVSSSLPSRLHRGFLASVVL